MKKVILAIFLLSATFITFGCFQKNPEILIHYIRASAVDANNDSIIDDNDLRILNDQLDKTKTDKLLPYMQKVGIDSIIELNAPKTIEKIKGILTVKEYETFMKDIDEYNKIDSEINETDKTITEAMTKPKEMDSKADKVIVVHVWGNIELSNGIVIKYAGIRIPVGGTDNKFARMVCQRSKNLIQGRIIRYKPTGKKVGHAGETYVYIGELCINEELVKMGYALAVREKSEESEKLIKLEEEAKASKKGLWAYHPDQNPFAEPLY